MKEIFRQGEFNRYAEVRLDDAREMIAESYRFEKSRKTTVFISHKHDDLNDLKGILGMLKSQYGVKVYIDSRDPSMPIVSPAGTAANIKNRICSCGKRRSETLR